MRFQVSAALVLSVASLVVAEPALAGGHADYDDAVDSYHGGRKSYGQAQHFSYSPGSDYSEKDSGDDDGESDYHPTWHQHAAAPASTTTSSSSSSSSSSSTSTSSQSTTTQTNVSGTSVFGAGSSSSTSSSSSSTTSSPSTTSSSSSSTSKDTTCSTSVSSTVMSSAYTTSFATYTTAKPSVPVYRTLWNFTLPNKTSCAHGSGSGTGTIRLPTATASSGHSSGSSSSNSANASSSSGMPKNFSGAASFASVNVVGSLGAAVFALAVLGL